jgi:hypothetical protein
MTTQAKVYTMDDMPIIQDLVGGLLNYSYININGPLYDGVTTTRGGGKAKTTKKKKTVKKTAKIPKKILNEIYEKINVLYIQFNKKNNSMKGGGDNGIPDNIFNMSDLDLRNHIPSAFDPSAVYGSPLSKFGT